MTQTQPPADDLVAARFWSKVDIRGPDECWPWLGAVLKKGNRGVLYYGGKNHVAPGISLTIAVGEAPADKPFACHSCDNPNCVNPAHLWWGTNSDNLLDASAKGRLFNNRKTHCPKGHPLSGSNLYIIPARGDRRCLACFSEYQIRRRNKLRAEGRLGRNGWLIRSEQCH